MTSPASKQAAEKLATVLGTTSKLFAGMRQIFNVAGLPEALSYLKSATGISFPMFAQDDAGNTIGPLGPDGLRQSWLDRHEADHAAMDNLVKFQRNALTGGGGITGSTQTVAGKVVGQSIHCDVLIYGATASGVMAAIAAKKAGKKAVIVDPGTHIGGMVTGGVSYTDTYGNDFQILTDEVNDFYVDMAGHYGKTQAAFWGESYNGAPAVAKSLLNARIAEYQVAIYQRARIKRVQKIGTVISRAVFELSDAANLATDFAITADVYIDASYEGDLLARAGCSYTVGREGNAVYNELDNGVRTPTTNGWAIDPYVTPGNSGSGLLPGIIAGPLAAAGSGDSYVQAYSYRVHITTGADKRPFPEPQSYNALNYEVLGRLCAAGHITSLSSIFTLRAIKDGMIDMNNGMGQLSLDYVMGSLAYPNADYATRDQIVQAHKDYTLGLFKFIREDSRVPSAVKTELATYGLPPRSQFDTDDGLPPQLYVREARRLVGDFVQTDRHCRRLDTVNDGIVVGVYPLDSHHVQRYVNESGNVAIEGGFFDNQGRFWISYGAMLPKATECTNLLVTFAISASHAAFSAIRMEPQAMMLGMAAGYAASQAIDNLSTVQSVSAAKVRQALGYDPANSIVLDVPDSGSPGVTTRPTGTVTLTGTWTRVGTLSSVTDASIYGDGYLSDGNANKGSLSIAFAPKVAKAGMYNVYIHYPHAAAGRATNLPVAMTNGGTAKNVSINATQDGRWRRVGVEPYYFAAGDPSADTVTISNTGTNSYAVVDAIALVPA